LSIADVALVSGINEEVKLLLDRLETAALSVGLAMNYTNTKFLLIFVINISHFVISYFSVLNDTNLLVNLRQTFIIAIPILSGCLIVMI
jgi:hypothetical protein